MIFGFWKAGLLSGMQRINVVVLWGRSQLLPVPFSLESSTSFFLLFHLSLLLLCGRPCQGTYLNSGNVNDAWEVLISSQVQGFRVLMEATWFP